jgi:selenocysteine lyase/cysteine desulfurase
VTVDGCSLIRTADKFEPWTPNLIGAIGLWSACDFYFENNIYEYIWEYEKILYWKIIQWLLQNNQISVLWSSSLLSSCGIISLVVQDPLWFSEYLASHNICVRAWWHCAHPLLHHLGQDKWVVRISPFFYNTKRDIEFLIQVMNEYKPY